MSISNRVGSSVKHLSLSDQSHRGQDPPFGLAYVSRERRPQRLDQRACYIATFGLRNSDFD